MALSPSLLVRHSALRSYRPLVEVLEDRTLPSFLPAVSYSVGTKPNAVAVADFNRDNIQDLAVINYYDSTVSILQGDGDGTFHGLPNFFAGGSSPWGMTVGDFNGDGNADLAVTYGSDSRNSGVSILLGNGDGTFQEPISYTLPAVPGPGAIAAADFNNDGQQDLVIGYASGAPLSVLSPVAK